MKTRFNLLILISLIIGIIGGLIIPNVMNNISFLGSVYINLLKFMIIPIIFTTIMITVYNSKSENNKMMLKTIIIFILMFIATFVLTSVIVAMLSNNISPSSLITNDVETTSLKISEIITNLFPDNLITLIANNSIFACIILAAGSGIAATKVENGNSVIDFVSGLKNIFNKLLEWIMIFTPIGVLSLVGTTTANYGSVIIGIAAKYVGIAYLCSFLILIIVMILPVWIINKINPVSYFKRMWKLWLLTMSTCSSLATLPATIKTCKEEFNISNKSVNLYVPIGCTIHKCGGAVSFALLSVFCCRLFGIEISLANYLIMLLSATFINMAAPGIPSGGIVLGATYLSVLNIPLTFMGVYTGIYRLLDMSYTTLNVTGNVTANILIDNKLKRGQK